MFDPAFISKLFGIGILLVQLDLVVIVSAALFDRTGWITRFVKKHALWLALFATGAAMVGSLTYSEILHFDPCKLCWFQRIFMYPSFFIALLALFFKDKRALRYILMLSLIGITISIYHYSIQMTGVSFLPCSATGQGPSCGGIYVQEFGYITIPMMALTLFAYAGVVSFLGLRGMREDTVGVQAAQDTDKAR